MTRGRFFNNLLRHLKLPFDIDDVTELDIQDGTARITLRNDEHPYIIRIEKLPIESDYAFPKIPDKEYKHVPMDIEIFSGNVFDEMAKEEKQFFWKDQSGRGFTNIFNAESLFDAFKNEVYDENTFKEWIDNCDIGDEYDSGTPNEIKRIK